MKLLVLNITTHVTQKNPLVLYDTDYQIQWGGEGELDYSEPVSYRDEWADFIGYKRRVDPDSLEGIFPGSGVLASDETVTYDYVYQVPAEAMNFRLISPARSASIQPPISKGWTAMRPQNPHRRRLPRRNPIPKRRNTSVKSAPASMKKR